MTTEQLDDVISKIKKIDDRLENLLKKGGNDEKLVAKRKELLKEYFKLKKELKDERVL